MGQEISGRDSGRKLIDLSNYFLGGGVREPLEVVEAEFEFEKQEIAEWTSDEVSHWLSKIGFGFLTNTTTSSFASEGVDLLEFANDDPVFETLNETDSLRLRVYLRHLRRCSRGTDGVPFKFKMGFHQVFQKFLEFGPLEGLRAQNLAAHSHVLSDWELIRKHLSQRHHYGEDEQPCDLRIFLVEARCDEKPQICGRLLGDDLKLTFPNIFGQFQVAIALGPWFFRWSCTSLLLPRRMDSGFGQILLDSRPLRLETTLDRGEVEKRFSKLLQKWNTKCSYVDVPALTNPEERNCMDFVEEVCRDLQFEEIYGVEEEETPILSFLRKVKTEGSCEMEFCASLRFVEEFQLVDYPGYREERVLDRFRFVFDTHQQLDDFVFWCYQTNPLAVGEFNAFQLLISFDRAYWMRHLNDADVGRWQPAPQGPGREYGRRPFRSGCPFSDPRSTRRYY